MKSIEWYLSSIVRIIRSTIATKHGSLLPEALYPEQFTNGERESEE